MARPALEVDEDHTLGFAEAGAAGVILFGGSLLQTEKIRQAETENRGASNPEQLAPSDAVARILPCETGNDKHNGTSGECFDRVWRAFWRDIGEPGCVCHPVHRKDSISG